MRVDVIVPIYNVERFLPQCVESLLKQTYEDVNIILVDDGSPDNCGKICEEYASQYDNVTVLHKENGGLSDARNVGIARSNSELIMFLDSDDWVEHDMIERMVSIMTNADTDIVVCQSVLEFPTQTVYLKDYTDKVQIVSNTDVIKLVLEKKINVSAWGKLYRRKLFEGIQYPVGCLHEDIPVIFKLLVHSQKKIAIMDSPLHHYRQQNASITHCNYTKRNYKFYEFVNDAKWVVDKYPYMKKSYEGFYYRVVKSLIVMFDKTSKQKYYEDYHFFKKTLTKNIVAILTNKTMSLKDRLAILLVLTPIYNNIKQLYNKHIR